MVFYILSIKHSNKIALRVVIRDLVTFKSPTTVHTNHSKDQPEDGSVYEPKHVARNKTKTPNKLRVVYNYIII